MDGFKGEKAIHLPYNVKSFLASNDITRLLYITHIGFYPKAKFHFRERKKGAQENIFIYCDDGAGWIEYNDERHYLRKNQAFIIPANESHKYGSDNSNPWTIYWLHFRGENVDFFSSIIGNPIGLENSDKSRYKDRLELFEEMYQNLAMGYSTDNLEYVSFCLMHFLASMKYLNQFREIKNIREMDAVQKGILYMRENLEVKITLNDITQHVGYSNSRFSTLFIKKTSYSPMEYYNQLKIQRACSYLQFSDLKIKEIAFRLGYYDPFHFSKVFKQEMKITPREYRKIEQLKTI